MTEDKMDRGVLSAFDGICEDNKIDQIEAT